MSTVCVPQIIFSEAWWIGTKEQNPDEKQMAMPPELQAQQVPFNHNATCSGCHVRQTKTSLYQRPRCACPAA